MAVVSRCPRCGSRLAHYQGQPYCPDCTSCAISPEMPDMSGEAYRELTSPDEPTWDQPAEAEQDGEAEQES